MYASIFVLNLYTVELYYQIKKCRFYKIERNYICPIPTGINICVIVYMFLNYKLFDSLYQLAFYLPFF